MTFGWKFFKYLKVVVVLSTCCSKIHEGFPVSNYAWWKQRSPASVSPVRTALESPSELLSGLVQCTWCTRCTLQFNFKLDTFEVTMRMEFILGLEWAKAEFSTLPVIWSHKWDLLLHGPLQLLQCYEIPLTKMDIWYIWTKPAHSQEIRARILCCHACKRFSCFFIVYNGLGGGEFRIGLQCFEDAFENAGILCVCIEMF